MHKRCSIRVQVDETCGVVRLRDTEDGASEVCGVLRPRQHKNCKAKTEGFEVRDNHGAKEEATYASVSRDHENRAGKLRFRPHLRH